MIKIPGLHHVTAISGPPQPNVDFYVGTLAQRLVKKTVNFDDPGTYHLYYGDHDGSPGTILTFFPFVGAGPGRPGTGMAEAVSYGLGADAFAATRERLAHTGTHFEGPVQRFGEEVLVLHDPDGMPVELVNTTPAVEGAFHGVTLRVADAAPTMRLLTDHFGYRHVGEENTDGMVRHRLQAEGNGPGSVIDVRHQPGGKRGVQGAGSIHHVAFRARTKEEQLAWRERLSGAGFQVTPVIDRQYFDAIYFTEPGGILFEIATDPPGFAVDESVDSLGEALKLPPRYEDYRARIEQVLPPLKVPA